MKDQKEISIDFTSRVGNILKKEREARKLTIRDVTQDTAISPRYLEALENDDFSQFPGETYAIGFLNNYADYLNIDKNSLIVLFHQQQMDTSPAPLAELTKPNSVFNSLRYSSLGRHKRLSFFLIFVLILGVAALSFFDFRSIGRRFAALEVSEIYCNGEREMRIANLPLEGSSPRSETLSLSPPDSLRFTADGLSLKFCLAKVKSEDRSVPLGIFHIRINDKLNYSFEIPEGKSFILSGDIQELKGLSRKLKFTPVVLSDYSARIELETQEVVAVSKEKTENDRSYFNEQKSFQNDIQVTLEFIKESYVEWLRDGQSYRGRLIPSGEVRTFEARNRLEIKVGNGGGIRIRREGAAPRIAGPASRIVKLEYRRVPDNLDPGISKIKETIEVVQ